MWGKTIAEQLVELEKICSTENIYASVEFESFSDNDANVVGKGFDFHDYMVNSKDWYWKKIQKLVESEIPNSFFTSPWDEYFGSRDMTNRWCLSHPDSDFAKEYRECLAKQMFHKGYWELFAVILACRGAINVVDVAKPICSIFVDVNRLGIFPLQCLVCNNLSIFKGALVECLSVAMNHGEDFWFECILKILLMQYK